MSEHARLKPLTRAIVSLWGKGIRGFNIQGWFAGLRNRVIQWDLWCV